MKATVSLKEGKSYTWGPHVFTKTPSVITDRDEIAKLKSIGVLSVEIQEDELVPPPESYEGEESGEGEDNGASSNPQTRKPAPVAKKPAATKAPGKPGPKANKPAPSVEPAGKE